MAKEERTYSEAILLAQLTINVERYIRETGIARPKMRSIDKMLSDVGIKTSDIADILGKTDRAVNMQIATDGKPKKSKTNKSIGE